MKKVLFIDDDTAVQQGFCLLAEDVVSEEQIFVASDGSEALAILRSDSEIAVVFCDHDMEPMDGMACINQAHDEGLLEGKEVFLTSASLSNWKKVALIYGYTPLRKPFDKETVQSILTNCLR